MLSLANANNLNPISYDRRNRTPYAEQWNINVQRQLRGGIVVEIGYNGNHFLNSWRQIEGNPAPPGAGSINPRRVFTTATIPGAPGPTTLSNVLRIQRDGFSRYNALQIKVEKRYAKGLYLLASYSHSRTIALQDGYQDPLNEAPEIGVADIDRPNYFVGSGLYDLPFGRGRSIGRQWGGVANALLGGWSFGPIVRANSGTPFNLSVAGNPSNNGVGKDRPNLVGDTHLANPTPNEWFNVSAFAKNAPYTYGNVPHNFLRGPSFFNVDAVLRKSFRLNERLTADLRLESFNMLNHTNLDPPNAIVGVSNFGTISSAEPSRSNQVGLKILF